jgi:hypothetical protein
VVTLTLQVFAAGPEVVFIQNQSYAAPPTLSVIGCNINGEGHLVPIPLCLNFYFSRRRRDRNVKAKRLKKENCEKKV